VKTILFVEDGANIVEIYRENLRREGFEVLILSANSLRAAGPKGIFGACAESDTGSPRWQAACPPNRGKAR
jgi:hypothetical protein